MRAFKLRRIYDSLLLILRNAKEVKSLCQNRFVDLPSVQDISKMINSSQKF